MKDQLKRDQNHSWKWELWDILINDTKFQSPSLQDHFNDKQMNKTNYWFTEAFGVPQLYKPDKSDLRRGAGAILVDGMKLEQHILTYFN